MKHLKGKRVLVTAGFMYAGVLESIAIDGITLAPPIDLVLDTGEWSASKWANGRDLVTPSPIWIERNSIESVVETTKHL